MSAECSQCHTIINDEEEDIPFDQRTPCPNCNGLGRSQSCAITFTATSSLNAQADVVSYPTALLGVAKDLHAQGQHGIAIVVAHIACEIAVERALGAAFLAAGVPQLEEPVEELMSGYNLGNDRHRHLYNALTGRTIQNEVFWTAFKTSATLRNKITHNAHIATAAEATASMAATAAFIAYL